MAEVSAALVKDLRTKTGAGMMDCKKALAENGGDIEQAIDWLRKKGLSAAAKKADRVAAEGLVAVASAGGVAAVVEVNSETDFVARNPAFQSFVANVAKVATEVGTDIDAIAAATYPGSEKSVKEELTNLIATIGENMNLRRAAVINVQPGAVATYVHSAVAPGLGRIGVLVALESEAPADKLEALGKQIAMHIAATNPASLDVGSLDQALIAREKDVLSEQARASGKPENIIEKMIEGRIRKFYEEVVLLEQVFIIDGETKVGKAVEALAKETGKPVKVIGFVRFALGEGIEKQASDFAAEVAAQAGR
ncbi:translation elongation factor Ts [Zavarzinia aquatilis]|uniref:Elongation factor Ts n=1 Tax=Zavarzinia aquatilis TaxID=2211142 RepID=A0A317EK73_9PROT|nr:translation elongation factor Ts [Zavarzinia aquatilis]PWR25823.1 elongation factor Ts [Zavarzinia aquatilis]